MRDMKALFMIEERTKHSSLHFRPVAANSIFLFRFWLLSIIAAFRQNSLHLMAALSILHNQSAT